MRECWLRAAQYCEVPSWPLVYQGEELWSWQPALFSSFITVSVKLCSAKPPLIISFLNTLITNNYALNSHLFLLLKVFGGMLHGGLLSFCTVGFMWEILIGTKSICCRGEDWAYPTALIWKSTFLLIKSLGADFLEVVLFISLTIQQLIYANWAKSGHFWSLAVLLRFSCFFNF